jgi:hypothetical protein
MEVYIKPYCISGFNFEGAKWCGIEGRAKMLDRILGRLHKTIQCSSLHFIFTLILNAKQGQSLVFLLQLPDGLPTIIFS